VHAEVKLTAKQPPAPASLQLQLKAPTSCGLNTDSPGRTSGSSSCRSSCCHHSMMAATPVARAAVAMVLHPLQGLLCTVVHLLVVRQLKRHISQKGKSGVRIWEL